MTVEVFLVSERLTTLVHGTLEWRIVFLEMLTTGIA